MGEVRGDSEVPPESHISAGRTPLKEKKSYNMAAPVDYSTYLVTDSTAGILGDRDLCQVIEAALQGGVTIVQYRDKHSSRDVVVETAKKLHDICKRFQVPFLINDQVDVAAEIGCEGVSCPFPQLKHISTDKTIKAHIGQDDLGSFTLSRHKISIRPID